MQERVNVLSNARTFYPMEKHIYRCKNRVLQRGIVLSNRKNVLYNATNVIFYKKNRPRKIVIKGKNDLTNKNF